MDQRAPPGMSRNGTRVPFVDYAKGVCITLVVTMHSTLGTGLAMGGEGFMHDLVAFARPFRMPDFFLIAGLFATQSFARDWRGFLERKVVHFAYFYLLWVFIQCAIKSVGAPEGAVEHFRSEFPMALIQPFGTLWFIYLLPIFFVTTRLLRHRNPLIVLLFAAMLETLRVDSGWIVIDEFCNRYIYFYSGYAFAKQVFAFAGGVSRYKALAIACLALWAAVEALAVATPGLGASSVSVMPFVSLTLGFAGALAVVAIATLLADSGRATALGWLGSRSIVVYLAFFLPMAATRAAIVKSGAIADIGVASLVVTGVAIVAPLLLARAVRGTWLAFLFERPSVLRLGASAPPRAARPPEMEAADADSSTGRQQVGGERMRRRSRFGAGNV